MTLFNTSVSLDKTFMYMYIAYSYQIRPNNTLWKKMSLFTCRIYFLKHDDLYVMASCYEYVHRTMCDKMDELRAYGVLHWFGRDDISLLLFEGQLCTCICVISLLVRYFYYLNKRKLPCIMLDVDTVQSGSSSNPVKTALFL